jgi:hypothetical protein
LPSRMGSAQTPGWEPTWTGWALAQQWTSECFKQTQRVDFDYESRDVQCAWAV